MSTPAPAQPSRVSKKRRTAEDDALETALPARDWEVPWLLLCLLVGIGAWVLVTALLAGSGLGTARQAAPAQNGPMAAAPAPAPWQQALLQPGPAGIANAPPGVPQRFGPAMPHPRGPRPTHLRGRWVAQGAPPGWQR